VLLILSVRIKHVTDILVTYISMAYSL